MQRAPQTLRKTVATLIEREQGAAPEASHLGHSNEQITRGYYIERDITAVDASITLNRFAPKE